MLETILVSFLAIVGITIVVLFPIALGALMDAHLEKRGRKVLAASACPTCGRVFESEVADGMELICVRYAVSSWRAVRGAPDRLWAVTCPNCADELYYRRNGKFFRRVSFKQAEEPSQSQDGSEA